METIANLLWINNQTLAIILIIWYIMPIIIWYIYWINKLWLFLTTIFLWRTPLPWIVLILEKIEQLED